MFGDLEKYKTEDFFKPHTSGTLYVNGQEYGLRFFAFLLVDANDYSIYDPIASDDPAYMDNLESKAMWIMVWSIRRYWRE